MGLSHTVSEIKHEFGRTSQIFIARQHDGRAQRDSVLPIPSDCLAVCPMPVNECTYRHTLLTILEDIPVYDKDIHIYIPIFGERIIESNSGKIRNMLYFSKNRSLRRIKTPLLFHSAALL